MRGRGEGGLRDEAWRKTDCLAQNGFRGYALGREYFVARIETGRYNRAVEPSTSEASLLKAGGADGLDAESSRTP
jgi:hypothetical protein